MTTDNHEFRQPPYGQERWDHDWHENFEMLDERVEIRGPQSARENYEPHENALFRATDTNNLYLGDGEEWVQIQSSGINPTFGTVAADRVRVSEAPEQDTDVVRNIDLDDLAVGDHDHTGDMLSPAEVVIGDPNPDPEDYPIAALSVAGVTFWIGDEETAEMADSDVFIDVS